ncbi:MAG: RagB/SusD family nutrient uptake outer membrane protein [Tissierellia bacterium]|mgnify:FL=1|nr:RagB/SusD family nutrient uptake outer membrane protein [Tissierellia bacterium]
MKIIKYYILILSAFIIVSCDNYLDIIPDNIATMDHAFRDKTRAEQYLFQCYSYMPRNGLAQAPGRFDDFMWSHKGVAWLNQLQYTILRERNNANNPQLSYWSGTGGATNLFIGIRDCNILIERINEVVDMDQFEKDRWAAEAKFLKAYYHFTLLQMYGPIPIIKENLPISASKEEVSIFREPVDEVFEYIVQILDEAIPYLPLTIQQLVMEQGRITQPIALALKAKVLVTAASPLFNGNTDYKTMVDKRGVQLFNQTYDPTKWEEAVTACKNAIDTAHLAGHALYEFYAVGLSDTTRLIAQPSRIVTDKWNPEHIWGTGHFGVSRMSEEYTIPALEANHNPFCRSVTVPTLKAVETFYSENGVPINEDIYYDYQNRYELTVTQEEDYLSVQPKVVTAKLHLNREPRFYGSIGFDNGWWYGLGRFKENEQWPINAKAGEASGPRGIERFSITSFFVKKLANFNASYNNTSYITAAWDFPIIRLADIYLLYAEALNETLDAPNDDVYYYVDRVRERAGLKGVVESWSTYSVQSEKYKTKEGMREIIQQERSIELAFEEHRFWDVRRWGLSTQEFNGPVQGWYYQGEDDAEFYRVTTVDDVIFTNRDIFWPIRNYDISVNPNLLQNLGW